MNILEMRPGRELDALVAEKVMGEKVDSIGWFKDSRGYTVKYPEKLYSTDIAAAWEVVEHIQKIKPYWRFGLLGGDRDFQFCWQAEWFGEDDPRQDYGDRHGRAYCQTISEAICKASLLAVGAAGEEK